MTDIKDLLKKDFIEQLNDQLSDIYTEDIKVSAYSEHEGMLPYSPTTLKKDKNRMSKQTSGYVQVIDGELNNIEFILNDNGKYSQKCAIIKKDKVRNLKRK